VIVSQVTSIGRLPPGMIPRVALASVVESTTWLYGDLQGIAGRSLLEIDGLELPLLDGPNASEAEWWSA
jgi:hypothetical protein